MLKNQLLKISKRIDHRGLLEPITLFYKKMSNLYMFYTAKKEIFFFVRVDITESPINKVSCNPNFNQIEKRNLKNKNVEIELLDIKQPNFILNNTKKNCLETNEHFYNSFLKICVEEKIPLKNAFEMKTFAGNEELMVRSPVESLDWTINVFENDGVYNKIEKIGRGNKFLDLFDL